MYRGLHRFARLSGSSLLATLLTMAPGLGQAQSSCSSDGQAAPLVLVERFIHADCPDCWIDAAAPRPARRELALDWVFPGSRGDDAPLSAVATSDAIARLQALAVAPPPGSASRKTPVGRGSGKLRVAHGLPVSGYVGVSIALSGVPAGAAAYPWTAWLALVENVPAGTEGTPVARNLVRNLIQALWDGRGQLLKQEHLNFRESRSMNIPPGMTTERLQVIGWVQDANGQILAAAQSRCGKAG